jgi:hypothetical protein
VTFIPFKQNFLQFGYFAWPNILAHDFGPTSIAGGSMVRRIVALRVRALHSQPHWPMMSAN